MLAKDFESKSSEKMRRPLPDRLDTPSTKSFERKTYWKSCCCRLDSRSTIFFSQLLISLLILLFSIAMLFYAHGDCSTENVYIALLSSVLGYWLPSPRLEH